MKTGSADRPPFVYYRCLRRILCAQLTRGMFAIAKFLVLIVYSKYMSSIISSYIKLLLFIVLLANKMSDLMRPSASIRSTADNGATGH